MSSCIGMLLYSSSMEETWAASQKQYLVGGEKGKKKFPSSGLSQINLYPVLYKTYSSQQVIVFNLDNNLYCDEF